MKPLKLCVVSPFPPELSGIGEYGWNIVHGLACTGRFSAITVLAQNPPARAAALLPGRTPTGPGSLVHTRHLWSRDDLRTAPRLARAIRAERPDAPWLH